jgi:cytochrome c5
MEEAVMLKLFLLFFAAILLALVPSPAFPGMSQAAAAQAPAAAQPAAPAQAAAPAGPMAPDAVNPVKPTPEGLAKAKTLFNMDCALCHGENGSGQSDVAKSMSLTLDNWTDPKTLTGKPDGLLFDTIRTGKGKMPPEAEARANDTAVWNLILYIRSFSSPQPAASGSASR